MHSNLRLEVPESVLSDGIFKDNKPLSAISLKTLLFLMYYFDGNCEDKVTVPLSDLCFDIVNIGLHFFLKNVRPYAASCSEA